MVIEEESATVCGLIIGDMLRDIFSSLNTCPE